MIHKVTNQLELHVALKDAKPGDTILLADGAYAGPFTVRNRPQLTIEAVNSGMAIIDGGNEGLSAQYCPHLKIIGVKFINADATGLSIKSSPSVVLDKVECSRNGVFGAFFGGVDGIKISNGVFSFNRDQHGVYLAEKAINVIVRGCEFDGNGRAGIQSNGSGPGGPNTSIWIDGCEFVGNGVTRQASAINILTSIGVKITGCMLRDNLAGGIAAYNESEVDVSGGSIEGTAWYPFASTLRSKITYSGVRITTVAGRPVVDPIGDGTVVQVGGAVQ